MTTKQNLNSNAFARYLSGLSAGDWMNGCASGALRCYPKNGRIEPLDNEVAFDSSFARLGTNLEQLEPANLILDEGWPLAQAFVTLSGAAALRTSEFAENTPCLEELLKHDFAHARKLVRALCKSPELNIAAVQLIWSRAISFFDTDEAQDCIRALSARLIAFGSLESTEIHSHFEHYPKLDSFLLGQESLSDALMAYQSWADLELITSSARSHAGPVDQSVSDSCRVEPHDA